MISGRTVGMALVSETRSESWRDAEPVNCRPWIGISAGAESAVGGVISECAGF